MSWFRNHGRQLPGQPITARTLRMLQETADWITRLRADPPLSIIAGSFGPVLRLAGMLFEVYIVVTTSTITARSGGTPGSGTAKVQTWNGTTLADLAGPVSFTVYNISAATGGISSGKYAIILKICGNFFIIAAEC